MWFFWRTSDLVDKLSYLIMTAVTVTAIISFGIGINSVIADCCWAAWMGILRWFFPSILRLTVEQRIIRIHNRSTASNVIRPIRMRQLIWCLSCRSCCCYDNNNISVLCRPLCASIRAGFAVAIMIFDVHTTVFQWKVISLLLLSWLLVIRIIIIDILAVISFSYECMIEEVRWLHRIIPSIGISLPCTIQSARRSVTVASSATSRMLRKRRIQLIMKVLLRLLLLLRWWGGIRKSQVSSIIVVIVVSSADARGADRYFIGCCWGRQWWRCNN